MLDIYLEKIQHVVGKEDLFLLKYKNKFMFAVGGGKLTKIILVISDLDILSKRNGKSTVRIKNPKFVNWLLVETFSSTVISFSEKEQSGYVIGKFVLHKPLKEIIFKTGTVPEFPKGTVFEYKIKKGVVSSKGVIKRLK